MTAPLEVLQALAEALDSADRHNHADSLPLNLGPNVKAKLAAYRAAIRPPLRTREEVDAEIADTVRQHGPLPDTKHGAIWEIRGIFPERLMALCAEPTSGPSSVDATDPPPVPVSPVGADYLPDHEACSCEEAEVLKDRLHELRRMVDAVHDLAKQIVGITETTPG